MLNEFCFLHLPFELIKNIIIFPVKPFPPFICHKKCIMKLGSILTYNTILSQVMLSSILWFNIKYPLS